MTSTTLTTLTSSWRAVGAALALSTCLQHAGAQDAPTLRARHAALRDALADSPFKRPLVLESVQNEGDLKGDVYSVVAQPYGVVAPSLQGMAHWCDMLIVHLNVKHCQPQGSGANSVLTLAVGRKFDQPIADAYKVAFAYRVAASSADFLRIQLLADEGPLGTKDYRIVLEAIPLDAKSSFIHMSYSYGQGMAARIAMQGYLGTLGRDKVGFSVVGRQPDGAPIYVGNVRGLIERNTMRYYLAIEAFLGATGVPPAEQGEQRMRDWYAATERYARQLHEMDRDAYLTMKRAEVARQNASAAEPK